MRKFFSALSELLRKPQYERLLVIMLPCIAVAVSAAIVAPQLSIYRANRAAALSELADSQAPQGSAQEQSDWPQLYLNAYSTGEDMYISVLDDSGSAVTGIRFRLVLTSPAGDEIVCATYDDGGCYLVELLPGDYTVSMSPQEGYRTADSIVCTVSSATHHAASLDKLTPGLNIVGGKLYYQSIDGRLARAVGLDLSCYNGRIEWDALKEQGVGFVILRLGGRGWGTGMIYRDTRFYEYLDAASDAGLNIGVYFYSTAVSVTEAAEEAEFIARTLAGTPLDLPVYLDCEYSGKYPNGRADRLSRAQRADILNVFAGTLRQYGYNTGFYSGTYFIGQELGSAALAPYSVWIANYTKNNALPSVSYRYDIWQYTESGRVRGVYGHVDINVLL